MEESTGSAFQPLVTERRQSVFRKLIMNISEHLQPDEVTKCSFIHKIPKDRASSALDTLECLMQGGIFSHLNVEPLVELLKDINRHDLVTEQVESFLKDYPNDVLSQSVPVPDPTQQIPIKERSNSVPADIAHASIPASPAVQETAAASGDESHINKTPVPSLRHPALESSTPQIPETPSQPPYSTPSSPIPGDSDIMDPRRTEFQGPPLQLAKIYTPVKLHDGSYLEKSRGSNAAASTTSSMDELGQFVCGPLSPIEQSSSQPERYMCRLNSATPPTEVSTLPRNNSYPRSVKMNTRHSSAGHMTPPTYIPPRRSVSTSRALHSATTPDVYGKTVASPATGEGSSHRHGSLPKAHVRPSSQASGRSETSLGRIQATAGDDNSPGDVFFPQSSSFDIIDPEGVDTSLQQTACSEGSPPALFRMRMGSRKKFFNKFTRSRDRTSSVIAWSVKRRKLNEAIYDHQKEKLFKCPRQLELENGGKHPPRLTLYIHPYGYEEDALQNVTLMVTLDISVKCHIPSSAVIRVEVEARNSSNGAKLKNNAINCPADSRIARCKSFLSHKELKELECENIEFVASAKLHTTRMTD